MSSDSARPDAGVQKYSLKRRLILKVGGFVAVAMMIITLAVVYVMGKELGRQAQNMLNESARSSQIQLENRITYLVEATRRLADNPFMINGLVDARARAEDLPKLIANFADGTSLNAVALLDYDGRAVFQAQQWQPDFNRSPELRAALAMGHTALYTDAATRQLFIIAPISYYATTQGALVVGFDLEAMVREHAVRNEAAYLQLSTDTGPLITFNRDMSVDYIQTRLAPSEHTPLMHQLDLTLEAGVPRSQYESVVTTTLSRFIGIGIILTLASAMVAAGIGQEIARPILELCDRVRRNPVQPCSPLGTGDELETLASTFDQRTRELQDVQAELQRQRDRFRHDASHDALTGLPNRYRFDQVLRRLVEQDAQDTRIAVTYIDLDRFKVINDSLGHPTGDRILQTVARRLQLQTGDRDQLFRHGGDEFILISELEDSGEALVTLLDRITQVLGQPVRMGEHDLDVSASIGVTLYPQDGQSVDMLVRNADIAMYRAKEQGGGRYRFFDEAMRDRVYERMEIEAGLRRAIDRGELRVHYQPQVDMNTGALIGTEALVRWQHPERGLIFPGAFIPIAEESRLIVDIGSVVLREACRQQASWYRQGFAAGRVSVNLAGPQIQDPQLVEQVAEVLDETGCRPEWLELEVTESFIMRDPASTIPTLKRLRALGISLAIDDFGTGYSSLAYLKRLPVTKLKIDQSFVRNSVLDPEDAAIIEIIIALGNKLKLDLIAEGIETEAQKALLHTAGCSQAQGFLYGRPCEPEALHDLMKAGTVARGAG
jgi:diguanylate cyclase (GGDEF)-like protein